MYQIMAQKIKSPTPYVTQSDTVLVQNRSLGPITLTVTPYVTFNVMLTHSLLEILPKNAFRS